MKSCFCLSTVNSYLSLRRFLLDFYGHTTKNHNDKIVHHKTIFLDLKYENNVHVYVKNTGQQTQLITYDTSRLCVTSNV